MATQQLQPAATAAAAKSSPMVALTSLDERRFEVPKDVATMSVTLKNMLEDLPDTDSDMPIPLPNVTGPVLEKVLEFCQYRHDNPPDVDDKEDDPLQAWEVEFCKVEKVLLFETAMAANYLDIKALLDVTCKAIGLLLIGLTTEQMRTEFGIKNDFTEEEEAQNAKDDEWIEKA